MLDEQIDQEKLVAQFRERLVSRLDEIGMGKSGLTAAFEEMDVTNRGELTIKELSNVLFKLNFHTSKVTSPVSHSVCAPRWASRYIFTKSNARASP